jgi:hypothetical protein
MTNDEKYRIKSDNLVEAITEATNGLLDELRTRIIGSHYVQNGKSHEERATQVLAPEWYTWCEPASWEVRLDGTDKKYWAHVRDFIDHAELQSLREDYFGDLFQKIKFKKTKIGLQRGGEGGRTLNGAL